MEKIIRDATCDRCGKRCASIISRELSHGDGISRTVVESNQYHYSVLTLQGYDNRWDTKPITYVLCGDCVNSLGDLITTHTVRKDLRSLTKRHMITP